MLLIVLKNYENKPESNRPTDHKNDAEADMYTLKSFQTLNSVDLLHIVNRKKHTKITKPLANIMKIKVEN